MITERKRPNFGGPKFGGELFPELWLPHVVGTLTDGVVVPFIVDVAVLVVVVMVVILLLLL